MRHKAVSHIFNLCYKLGILILIEIVSLQCLVAFRRAHLPERGNVYHSRNYHAFKTVVGNPVGAVLRNDVHNKGQVGLGVEDVADDFKRGIKVE